MNGDIFWICLCSRRSFILVLSTRDFCPQIKREKCQKDISIWNHAYNEAEFTVSKLTEDTLVYKQIALTHFVKAVQT